MTGLIEITLHPEVVKFLEEQNVQVSGEKTVYILDGTILKIKDKFYKSPIDKVGSPPEYITTQVTELWDAFSCKTNKDKVVLIHLPKDTKVLLFDCDPSVVSSELVGVKVLLTGEFEHGATTRRYVGFVDKSKIAKI